MLKITKLYTVYPVFLDLDEALKYFDDKRSRDVKLWRRTYGNVLVLEIAGSLTLDHGADAVERAILAASDGNARNVICLCTQLLDASPEGCALLARSADALRLRGRDLVLANAESRLDADLGPCDGASIRRYPTLDGALAAFDIHISPRDRMNTA
jgi:hypothetical protein